MVPSEPVYFVQISDTHIGPDPRFSRHGVRPLPCARRIVDLINRLPQMPDFVIHTGDVVAHPEAAAYELAAETFATLGVPIYYVNGNHDCAGGIRHYLPMGAAVAGSDDEDKLTYHFDVKGWRCLVLDSCGPEEIDPRGWLAPGQLAWLDRQLAEPGPPLLLFLHHPVLPLNSIWMDAYMLILNGDALHERLVAARERLRGVFYGHVHQPMQTVSDGVFYCGAASTFAQFAAWPEDAHIQEAPAEPPGFNFVHLLPRQIIVHQHTFERPSTSAERP